MALRETRNNVTHDHAFVTKEILDGFNLFREYALLLTLTWESMDVQIGNRVLIRRNRNHKPCL
jgi:hypothetical protein